MKEWIGKNTVRITAFVTALIACALEFDWVDWSESQIAGVMGLLAAVLVFFVSSTVTANVRLNGGKMFGSLLGKAPPTSD